MNNPKLYTLANNIENNPDIQNLLEEFENNITNSEYETIPIFSERIQKKPHNIKTTIKKTEIKYIWDVQTVDSTDSVGWDTSIALDSSDNPHISYWDNTNYYLKYAFWNGSGIFK